MSLMWLKQARKVDSGPMPQANEFGVAVTKSRSCPLRHLHENSPMSLFAPLSVGPQ